MDIDIADCLVEEISTEYAVTLGLSGGPKIRIETRFELAESGQRAIIIDPQNLDTDQELQRSLFGRTVDRAIASLDSGSLAITFDGGVSLQVAPDADYEAWSATWPDGSTMVCLPGGGVSQWGAQK